MIELKKGKNLWFGIAVIILTALLTLYNISSFKNGLIYDIDEPLEADVYSTLEIGRHVINTGALATFIGLFILMSAALIFRFKLPDWAERTAAAAFFLCGPMLTFETVKLIIGVPRYDSRIYWLNVAFYAVLQLIVFLITQSARVSFCTAMAVGSLLNFANEIVLLIRGTPVVPTDLYAIGTAMKVTTTSDWHFNVDMLTGLCACIMLIALAAQFKFEYPKKWLRPCAAAAAAALLCVGVVGIYNIDYESFSTSTFDTESTNNVNGTALSFYINWRKMDFDPPEGYSEEALFEFLEQYKTQDTLVNRKNAEADNAGSEVSSEDRPNIIVIMNESFSDLGYIGRLKTNVPYMPYFNSLITNCEDGRVLVSVLGGGTCNTEFEFLTGLSMMYMPSGCYTYMQHIKRPVESMASYLKGYGYDTVAMHPFYEVCWKRNSVYKFMGFDDFISGEDMASGEAGLYVSADRWEKGFGDKVEYIRTLISDSFFYKQIEKRFEEKDDDPLFIFGVTVQNHSTYEYDGDDFETDVHIERPEGEFPRAEQYLSLIKDSDEALEELIDYFSKVDEKTMIVFFGDHQPNVEAELIDALDPNREQFVNAYLTRFETPFVIWSNFDIDTDFTLYGVTSANFLGVKTLMAAGIPLSEKYKMILDAEYVAPAMATWGYYDRFFTWNSREDVYSDEVLNMYGYYAYWALTDGKY